MLCSEDISQNKGVGVHLVIWVVSVERVGLVCVREDIPYLVS